jgi:Spy/CpxP family protein refolding chaperone
MKVGRTIPVLLVSFVGAVTLSAQQPTPPPAAVQKMEMPGKPGMMDEKMTEDSMMAHHKEMMAKMEAMDARLDDLVKRMNAATGSKKPDAVAAVINELVAQRKQMREQMMAMQPEMMKHMTAHMRMGMIKGMEDSMAKCPMMKTMAPAKDEHSEHHSN